MTPPFPFPDRGLYVITDTAEHTRDQITAAVSGALKGGARVIQYREKTTTGQAQRRRLAARLRDLCQAARVPFIVNDDLALAGELGADGVHLGKHDCTIDQAKNHLGPDAIIGVSCYASLDRALWAQEQGATYVAFGRFFSSNSKPHATPAMPAVLREAKRNMTIPIVAIGGITPENGAELLVAGADLLAVIESISAARNPEQAALAFQSLFT